MKRIKEIMIVLSLANLCFLREWAVILEPSNWLFINITLIPLYLIALILNVLALAAVFYVGLILAQYFKHAGAMKLVKWIFLGMLIILLNVVREFAGENLLKFLYHWDWRLLFQYNWYFIAARLALYAFVILGLFQWRIQPLRFIGLYAFSALLLSSFVPEHILFTLILLLILFQWQKKVIRPALIVLLMLSPFILITFSQAIWKLAKAQALIQNKPVTKQTDVKKKPKVRVLWLIFDEMDQSITFANRPQTLDLPELDKLRAQSFYATNAYSPATQTVISIPSLLIGQYISKSEPISVEEVLVTLKETGEKVKLSAQPSIFSSVKKAGIRTASIAGYSNWFALLKDSNPTSIKNTSIQMNFYLEIMKILKYQTYRLLPLWGASRQETLINQIDHRSSVNTFKRNLYNAKLKVEDPNIGFIFSYFGPPHQPSIYDRQKKEFIYDIDFTDDGYLDNLALVDRTIGELRSAMEQAGTWKNTTVILSSDHHWRSSKEFSNFIKKRWVPFLVKFADQKKGFIYNQHFNTIITHDLVLAILNEEISNPQEFAGWLDQRL